MRRVSRGYVTGKSQEVEGLGAGFQFCHLATKPLFDHDGQINPQVTFKQLAEFVWFHETGVGFSGILDSPFLGEFEGRGIYLLYNGILKDKSVQGGNVLTQPIFDVLPPFDGSKTIYAAACRGNHWLKSKQITFKQTPYALDI